MPISSVNLNAPILSNAFLDGFYGGGPPGVKRETSYDTYQVKTGDCLIAIAKKFGTSAAYLAELNKLPNPDLIKAGQILKTSERHYLTIMVP
ncbi:MAG TPA: hypothetical protein DDW49_02675 [Deltaproteobacteria bacterium]|nr:MAG: hypothetical protein A2048_00725 [Deltaproteobacteria bacterium GWA2_45_12]HBF12283.1 hypothetical protein [Deltaproteobacteria bacterium]